MHGIADQQPSRSTTLIWMGVVVGIAAGAGLVAVFWLDSPSDGSGRLRRAYDDAQYVRPELVKFERERTIDVPMAEATALAIDDAGVLHVAGENKIVRFGLDGQLLGEIETPETAWCLAIAPSSHRFPGRIYTATADHVNVLDSDGELIDRWDLSHDEWPSLASAVALFEDDVFVADRGARLVWRFDSEGQLLGRIGEKVNNGLFGGFLIPSPFFDLAVSPDGLLRVVNPGRHRIEAFTPNGYIEEPLCWGETSIDVDGFCGCCNPTDIAIFPDGRYITAEKTILRVKVYNARGQFSGVVAPPKDFPPPVSSDDETGDGEKAWNPPSMTLPGGDPEAPSDAPLSSAEAAEMMPHWRCVFVEASPEGRVAILDPSARGLYIYAPIGEGETPDPSERDDDASRPADAYSGAPAQDL